MGQTPSLAPRPYRLDNPIQHYAWGTRGSQAFIAHLLGRPPEPGKPYAELWIGAHPSAPSRVSIDGRVISLDRLIGAHPQTVLGKEVAARFQGSLPFLFKVLSAGQALSIQAHPNKAQARMLHERDPRHYPDPNHKPELAVALDFLDALAGFKPLAAIQRTLARYPEITAFIDSGGNDPQPVAATFSTAADPDTALLKKLVSRLVILSEQEPRRLRAAIDELAARLRHQPPPPDEEQRLFLELSTVHTEADIGLFFLFLLNRVHLEAGQGLFIDAGVPHAYLKGNIVECMANSDNVVRVGLTPKFKDGRTLVEILTYSTGPPALIAPGQDAAHVIYQTPASEFQVESYRLSGNLGPHRLQAKGPQVLLVTGGSVEVAWEESGRGNRLTCGRGDSLFLPACLQWCEIRGGDPGQVFRVRVPEPR